MIRLATSPAFIVTESRQCLEDALRLNRINAADCDSRMNNDVIAFVCIRDAGHVANAPYAVELDFGLRKGIAAFDPANYLSWNA
jgi:hypothetical protein